MTDLKSHWENIYSEKEFRETSWYQGKPETSLEIIEALNLSKDAEIIDVGGGDSYLVDNLLHLGYTNLNVLDISVNAIERAKDRIGEISKEVKWIVSDASEFTPDRKFDLWHDRAAFHFLTDEKRIRAYISSLNSSLKPGGYLILGTFSENGPDKCSGIQIKKYSKKDMESLMQNDFQMLDFKNVDHVTPWNAVQNFNFGLFRKK